MAEYQDREQFIPLRPADLVLLLGSDEELSEGDREQFRQLCRLLAAVFHFEYHEHLSKLRNSYAPFDPDADTKTLWPLTAAERSQRLDKLFEEFLWLLERANFKRLSREELREASRSASDWGINMDIEFDVFERLEVFVRGDVVTTRTRRRLRNRYQLEETQVPSFQRLVLILKQRPHKRLGPRPNTESVFLKIFKDIPKNDIEMLLPGTRIIMPGVQRLKLGSSVASALGYVGYKLYLASAELVTGFLQKNPFAFWGPISLVLGYGYKQYYGYQTTRQSYSLMLTQSLYYQNLDNNAGVIARLVNEAEDQEFREAVLAYFFLWRAAGEGGWSAGELDDHIEDYLVKRAGIQVDFEIGDALAKLERLGLAVRTEDRYRVEPVGRALEILDTVWDNYFLYHNVQSPAAG